MDEFAQTRGADDLFEDDFTYVAPTPPPAPQQISQPPPQQTSTTAPSQNQGAGLPELERIDSNISGSNTIDPSSHSTSTTASAKPTHPPRSRTPVRGDRTLTGGLAKPKLTEEELSAKLAAAKLNSTKRAEAHARAEADEADFQAREAQAQKRRVAERRDRRVMDMEREKNRIRKLGAMGGREWDEGKEEVQASEGRGRGSRRGMNGGVGGGRGGRGGGGAGLYTEGLPDREPREQWGGDEFRGRGRGRGGRGRGRGRGADSNFARGGFERAAQRQSQTVPDPVQDFPALPPPSKPKSSPVVPPDKAVQSPKPGANDASWADQVTEAQA